MALLSTILRPQTGYSQSGKYLLTVDDDDWPQVI